VFPADAELQVRLHPASTLDRDPHQVADAADVDRFERVLLQNAVLEVVRQELPLRIVAGETKSRLRQVVRPEGEEVGVARDLVGADACTR